MCILLGFDCRDEFVIELKDKKILVVHGDIFDIYFTRFKWITNIIVKLYYYIRHYSPFADDVFKLLKHKTNNFIEKSGDMKNNGLKYIDFNGYDKVICGHSHIPEQNEKYINTGSFCEERCSFVVVDKEIKLIYQD